MARFSPALTSFDAGEWSPLLRGQVDAPKYGRSCRLLKNFISTKQGPARKRPGTRFVNTTKSNAQVRPIPWVFSEDQAYVLEVGAGHIRFWTESGFIETTPGSGTPYEIANSWTLAQVQALQFAQSADVVYLTQTGGAPQVLSRFADNSWTLTDFSFVRGPFMSENGDAAHELRVDGVTGTVNVESDNALFQAGHVGALFAMRSVPELLYDQWVTNTAYTAGDYVWSDSLESPGRVNVYKATTSGTSGTRAPGHDAGTFSDGAVRWQYIHDGRGYIEIASVVSTTLATATVKFNEELPADWVAWKATGSIALTGQPSDGDTITFDDSSGAVTFEFDNDATVSTGNIAVTIGGDVATTWGNFTTAFDAQSFSVAYTESGESMAITHQSYGSVLNIAITKSGANITVSGMSGGAGDGVTTGGTRWSEGSWSDYRGWPRAVTLHDERLWFGYTASEPTTVWGSVIDDYTNFDAGAALDDEAVTKVLGGDALNPIQWLSSNDELVVGTTGGVFISQTGAGVTITPTNVQFRSQSQYGASSYAPAPIGPSVVYSQRGRRNLREFLYNDDINRYNALDLSMAAEHLFEEGINHLAWMNEPDPILWSYDDTGDLIGVTYDRSEQILGVHQHDVSGTVEGVCVIPSADGTQDRLWLTVQRTVNGSTVRHIEYLDKYTDEVHADSYVTNSGTDLTTLAVAHLEGESVSVLADGATRPEATVSSGSITVSRSADTLAAGLPMIAYLTPQQIEGGSTNGTAQGKPARMHKAVYRLYRTGPGMYHGAEGTDLQQIPFRRAADAMDTAVPLKTGDTDPISVNSGYGDGQLLAIEHRGPQPCTIVAIWPQMEVEDNL